MPEGEKALALASKYMLLADVTLQRGMPVIHALYDFAARQMAAYTQDREGWHVQAATAAAHDATRMHDLVTGRGGGGGLGSPGNL